jgi:hypothetical protein
MNTNSLARHYDTLAPRERLPLIMAASLRKDDPEYERLTRSAPRLTYCVPDFYGLSEGIFTAVNSYMLQQLALTARFFLVLGLACNNRGGDREHFWNPINLSAHLLVERAEGWRLFCADYGIDPAGVPSLMPGWDVLQGALELARLSVVSRETAVKYFRERSGDHSAEPFTAEDVRREYRAAVERQAATWK